MAASRFLWNQDRFQALPDAERTAPSERGPAVLAPAPSVILERDARGSTHPARSRCGPLDATPPALVVDLGFEPLSRFLRIPGEGQSRQVIAFRENVPGLPKENADLGRAEVVRLRFLQDGLARANDRLGLLDLSLPELHRPLDLSLLTFHREPLRAFEEIPRVAVLAGGDGGLRRLMEFLCLAHVRSDVPRKANVVRDESNRFLDLANPAEPRVLHSLGRLDETLPRRGKPIPVEGVAPSLPRVLGQGDRCTEVRGLANRIPREGEQIPHPVRLPPVGHLRGPDEVLQEGIVQELALEEHVSGAVEERAGRRGLRVLRIAWLQETLRREDGVRPRSAAELLGGALRDAGRFLRRGQRGFELAFLESFAGLIEQVLDPFVVDIRVASQHESRIPLRGVLGLEFHEDLGGAGGGGDGGDQVRFPLQSEEAHPMSLAELAELTGSKSF